MNEFLNQFLIECREFVEQATAGLLTLERAPDNAEVLDGVFRAFHTLKGGAGIVEFAAMEQAVHAAENVLSDARSGRQALTVARTADCLSCLDQVAQWLDIIEHTGELPADSEIAAAKVIRRFTYAEAAATATSTPAVEWVVALLKRHAPTSAGARTAIRYIPDPDCFYQGADPIARVTSLPGLLAVEIGLARPAAPLATFDPFVCNLDIKALTSLSPADVDTHLHGCAGDCESVAVGSVSAPVVQSALPAHVREVLEWQAALLQDDPGRNLAGRLACAGLTATNILKSCGQPQRAQELAQAAQLSIEQHVAEPLLQAIARALGPLQVAAQPADAPSAVRVATGTRTLRVEASRIDTLVRLTSELTVAKNAVGHLAKLARAEGNTLAGTLRERHGALEHLVSELQRSVLGLRVMPLRSVLQRFPRIVREMSTGLGKPLNLIVEGDDTEADKAIVEMLFEPLLHIVRNAVDHGVEAPPVRAQRGKPAMATLTIRAARRGDQVLIEVSDDGGGINVERVRQVALDRRVATEEQLRAMTPQNIVELIFAPGFSTAAQVTELSGRGVGMDAVRSAVERMGGRVAIDTRVGQGTTLSIHLPFSVLMTRIMTVEAADQIFGIPLDAITETIRVPAESIAAVGAARAIVVGDRTVPLINLGHALQGAPTLQDRSEATVVITTSAGQLTGIQVDRLGEQMEVILQPLDGLLAGTPGITGTTLLGDGRVLLVLDIGAMLQ